MAEIGRREDDLCKCGETQNGTSAEMSTSRGWKGVLRGVQGTSRFREVIHLECYSLLLCINAFMCLKNRGWGSQARDGEQRPALRRNSLHVGAVSRHRLDSLIRVIIY